MVFVAQSSEVAAASACSAFSSLHILIPVGRSFHGDPSRGYGRLMGAPLGVLSVRGSGNRQVQHTRFENVTHECYTKCK